MEDQRKNKYEQNQRSEYGESSESLQTCTVLTHSLLAHVMDHIKHPNVPSGSKGG